MPDPASLIISTLGNQSPVSLAFMVWTDRQVAGSAATGEQVIAGDWFVVAHLAFFFLLLGCFGLAVWSIWRRTTRPEPHVRLLMELEEENAASGGSALARGAGTGPGGEAGRRVERQPWERADDWWRQ